MYIKNDVQVNVWDDITDGAKEQVQSLGRAPNGGKLRGK